MVTKWTTGEWVVEEDAYPHPPQITAGGILIAEVGNATDDYDAFLANAHLIAAAPKLYEALGYAHRWMRSDDPMLRSVLAALAKARGEA